jgi:DNA-binding response OmpR family regulator
MKPLPQPCTVLLLDDDQFIVDMFAAKFTQQKHTVVPCLRAEDALKKLRTGLVPDVIMTDLTMPFIDGFDFIATLRAEKLAQGVPVVVLSNQDDFVDVEKTHALHVTAHYIKIRSTPAEVVALIEGVVSHVRHPESYPDIPQQ